MKRDYHLIRSILISEESNQSVTLKNKPISISEEVLFEHLKLMDDMDLIDAKFLTIPYSGVEIPEEASVIRILQKGHDFLSVCRIDSVWKEVSQQLETIPWTGDRLYSLLEEACEIHQQTDQQD